MKITYYGIIQEKIGKAEEVLNFSSTEHLMEALKKQHPFLSEITYTVFVNQQLINEDTLLTDTDEVVLCPPFAGG